MNNVKRTAVAAVIVVAGTVGLAGTAGAADYGSSTTGSAAPLGPDGAYLGSTVIYLARLLNSLL
jgi:hypothetical protein